MNKTVLICALGAKYMHASLAPWCLAAGVKEYASHIYKHVRVVEGTINDKLSALAARILEQRPSVMGFSCYIWNIDMTLKLAKALKAEKPEMVIILGGPEVSFRAEELLVRHEQIDFISQGEGEESFPLFLQLYFEGGDLKTVPGLCGRGADGELFQNAPKTGVGTPPLPIEAGYTDIVKGRIAYFETSRGCPYACAFCLSGSCGAPRYFDLDKALPALTELSKAGAHTIKFVDRTFNAKPSHSNRILRHVLKIHGIETPSDTCFHFEIAGDILKEESFLLYAAMPPGAVQLEIGIQSLNEKTLRAVNRKTDTKLLLSNIKRLIGMKNMHIHIDLIAGLPYEDLSSFTRGFDRAIALNAHMLQLGFLKLLFGSDMREHPELYPCEYDKNAPYEVCKTPWLSEKDFWILHRVEDALDRVYNSGRLRQSAEYVLEASGLAPFEFYKKLGIAQENVGIKRGISLDDYTEFFMKFCQGLENVDEELLRDALVCDRLMTNASGSLPPCLRREDRRLGKMLRALAANPQTAPTQGVRRGAAILYGEGVLCYVDYEKDRQDPVTGRYEPHRVALS